MPLMLPSNDKVLIDAWLDPYNKDIEPFQSLLIPQLNAPQRITPIGRPSKWDIQGEPQILR